MGGLIKVRSNSKEGAAFTFKIPIILESIDEEEA